MSAQRAGDISERSVSFEEEDHVHVAKFELQGDLYTLVFMSYTGLPTKLPGGQSTARTWAMSSMLLVALIQILMTYTVYLHVQNDLIDSKERPLLTAYEMFVGNNNTMPITMAEHICGQWEAQESYKDIGVGPLSSITMPDGAVFSSDETYPMFYNLKQPTRTWDYGRLSSDRSIIDDIMFVISEGVNLSPFTPSGYSLLFILMISMFVFSVAVEFRKIYSFAMMLLCAPSDTGSHRQNQWMKRSPSELEVADSLKLSAISTEARRAGLFAVSVQFVCTTLVGALGVFFLFYTTIKIDLILNGLALLFILELDRAIYLATVPSSEAKMLESLEPIEYATAQSGPLSSFFEHAGPIMFLPVTFLLALALRYFQCETFRSLFKMTAAICMFAGPTPGGMAHHDQLVGPVYAFCDSLLGATCAPSVTPKSALKEHGHCVITDQTWLAPPTLQMYLNDPDVFHGRFNPDGSSKSWVEWGRADPRLYESEHWMDGPYQNILRKNCLQLYRKQRTVGNLIVDTSGNTGDGAPFMCARDEIVHAVFGPVRAFLSHKIPKSRGMEMFQSEMMRAIRKTRSLEHPAVVRAMDRCNVITAATPDSAASGSTAPPAPAAPVDFAANKRTRRQRQLRKSHSDIHAGTASEWQPTWQASLHSVAVAAHGGHGRHHKV